MFMQIDRKQWSHFFLKLLSRRKEKQWLSLYALPIQVLQQPMSINKVVLIFNFQIIMSLYLIDFHDTILCPPTISSSPQRGESVWYSKVPFTTARRPSHLPFSWALLYCLQTTESLQQLLLTELFPRSERGQKIWE